MDSTQQLKLKVNNNIRNISKSKIFSIWYSNGIILQVHLRGIEKIKSYTGRMTETEKTDVVKETESI